MTGSRDDRARSKPAFSPNGQSPAGMVIGGLLEARLLPTSFSTPDGAGHIAAWASRLPEHFAARLADDFEGLRQVAAEQTAARNGGLIDFDPVTVAGRPTLRRVESLPSGLVPGVRYAGALIVTFDDGIGVEITVTCRVTHPKEKTGDRAELVSLGRTRAIIDALIPHIAFLPTDQMRHDIEVTNA